MEKVKHPENQNQDFSFTKFLLKYLPFWPLFLLLFLIGMGFLYYQLTFTVPVYQSNASILIKDQTKGQEDSKMEDILNLFDPKKTVENEIEIIRSADIMKPVVDSMKLYSTIYREEGWNGKKIRSAYHTSPFAIEVDDPDKIIIPQTFVFTISPDQKTAVIENEVFALNEWKTLNGIKLRFVPNAKYKPELYDKSKIKFLASLRAPMEKALGIIAGLQVAQASKQSSVLTLNLKDEVPQRGEEILVQLVNAYNNNSLRRKNEVARKTLNFIEKRLASVESELDSLEKDIQSYRDRNAIVDISAQGRQYLQGIEENDRQLNNYNIQMAALGEVENYVKSKSEGGVVPSTLNLNDPTLTTLITQLANAESQYEKLKKTTAENNPIVLGYKDEIERLRPSILENVQNQKKVLQSSKGFLDQTNRKFSSMLGGIPKKERELVEVSRQQAIKNDIYSFLLQKREETAYSISSYMPDCYIVDAPVTAKTPVQPKTPFLATIAFILPFLLGFGLISLKEMISGNILYRSDIEKLTRFPVLGEFIHEKNRENFIIAGNSRTFISEQFRQLRNTINQFQKTKKSVRKILVTSSIKGEGKSLIAANLAYSFARSGKKVALLEFDLHQPKTTQGLNMQVEMGISDYLAGDTDTLTDVIYQTTHHENLSLVPCGNLQEEPTELLSNGRMDKLLKELNDKFDILIIDTAPVKAVTDAYLIANSVDLILYIIRHNYTPKVHVESLDSEMELHGIKDLAVLFNGVKNRGFGKYSYGYGYGYGNDYKSTYSNYTKRKESPAA